MKKYTPKISNKSVSLRYALMSVCLSSVCHSVVFDHVKDSVSYDRMVMLTVLFNVISVGAMGIVSVFADRVGSKHTGVRLSVLLTILGYFLPISFGIDLKIVLLGLGSALFYSFAASSVISRSGGKSKAVGLLLGGQSVGAAIATFGGFAGHALAPILMMLAVPSDKYEEEIESRIKEDEKRIKEDEKRKKTVENAPFSPLPLVFLMLACLVLSYELSSLRFSWNVIYMTQFQLLFVVGLGRGVGGYISDIFGRVITVAASACSGSVLLFFCADSKYLSLLGLFLLSMSLTPTVSAIARILPKHPALSFALATLSMYLGQSLCHLVEFNGMLIFLICAVLIASAFAAETPYLPKEAENEAD